MLGITPPGKLKARWWQLKYFWNFHPYLGKISNLTRWVETTNQKDDWLEIPTISKYVSY